jgi:hypothetical protein
MCSIRDENVQSKFGDSREQAPVFEAREEIAGAVSVKQVSLHKEQGTQSKVKYEEPAKGSAQWFNERFNEHLFELYSVA